MMCTRAISSHSNGRNGHAIFGAQRVNLCSTVSKVFLLLYSGHLNKSLWTWGFVPLQMIGKNENSISLAILLAQAVS